MSLLTVALGYCEEMERARTSRDAEDVENRRSRSSGSSWQVALVLAVVLILAHVVSAGDASAAGQFQIVAHEDDDLYFMTPAALDGIASGAPSWTVFLSAGDAGRTNGHWQSRELGIRAAYASMRGLPDLWSVLPLSVDGRALTAFALVGAPEIVVVFLRLPDGDPSRRWRGELYARRTR